MKRRGPAGFTLVEMMLTLVLVALVYTIVSTILVQVARYVRLGKVTAQQRLLFLKEIDDFRYQLRSLYYPAGLPGLLAEKTSIDGRDNFRYLTTNGRKYGGVIEASLQIQDVDETLDPKSGGSALFYREFPYRVAKFRTLDPDPIAPWSVRLGNVDYFELQFSLDGINWEREYKDPVPPKRIRVRIERGGESPDQMVFDVTPGVGASRW